MNQSPHESPTALMRTFKLVLWKQHQPYIALLVATCLLGMSCYFVVRSLTNQGLVDIDSVPKQHAEYRVDINAAEWPEIVVLPGVGEKLARAIVDYRDESGPFESIDAIQDVPGIGESKLSQLRPYLLPIPTQE